MADFENKNNTQWNENNAAQNGASAPNAAGTADSVKKRCAEHFRRRI